MDAVNGCLCAVLGRRILRLVTSIAFRPRIAVRGFFFAVLHSTLDKTFQQVL
jgi:hypothetical protein